MSARTDTERLEWLERSGAAIDCQRDKYIILWSKNSAIKTGDYVAETARAAIDAAMDAEERG